MGKRTHVVRVWARRASRSTLEFSLNSREARRLGLQRVKVLQSDATVDGIEMREHVVVETEMGMITARRRSFSWARTDGRWRRLSDTGAGVPMLHTTS